jgi:hypothetical protein
MEMTLLSNRRREVLGEIARLKERLSEMEAELVDIDAAGRVIARLSGAEWPPSGAQDKPKPAGASGAKPEGTPTMPEMIKDVLARAHRQGRRGMEPKEIAKAIAEQWWPDVRGDHASSITWRMWKRGDLEKVEGTTLYRLPQEDKAPDADAAEQPSGALFQNPSMRPVEPEPGGGT